MSASKNIIKIGPSTEKAVTRKNFQIKTRPKSSEKHLKKTDAEISELNQSKEEQRNQEIVNRRPPKGLLLKQRKLFVAVKNNKFSSI
mmetsp:Transcript_40335/g.35825  ORF Transcript_40335/g.35825 Transcript_40335/m.35825 type:complete len:87 (+) Transcript_40335:149-409(+)